ncbi:MAG: class I SAM-dependent methyltransferase, partial [Planctomycetales bacterium]|nr:class I SAM-dependent methyltransferase [Planctomycetales bacterium]
MARITRHIESQICCDPEWEAAYRRFESPEQEIEKFLRRYREFGIQELPRDSAIAEIFCGRGGGLVALARMNFTNLQGVDLSEQLLLQYEGEADLHLADCRELPQTDQSLDA